MARRVHPRRRTFASHPTRRPQSGGVCVRTKNTPPEALTRRRTSTHTPARGRPTGAAGLGGTTTTRGSARRPATPRLEQPRRTGSTGAMPAGANQLYPATAARRPGRRQRARAVDCRTAGGPACAPAAALPPTPAPPILTLVYYTSRCLPSWALYRRG